MASQAAESLSTDAEQQRVTSALLAVARHLEGLTEERARQARRARVSWSGAHRDRFDAERATRDGTAEVIISRCRQLARP